MILDGFFFGFGAVVNRVDARRFGRIVQVLTHASIEPGLRKYFFWEPCRRRASARMRCDLSGF